ncbi:MAG: type I-U CRISPR-associated protein Csx17 [Syntrophaceae bacterium]
MFKHELLGCLQIPMANYLKAMGLLRLLAEQKDPGAVGCWGDHSFVIITANDRNQLLDFFCNEYSPTPIVDPWNGGSGFYPGDNAKALDEISKSSDTRFKAYREVIELISSWNNITFSKKYREGNKHYILTTSRSKLPDAVLNWLDAAFVLLEDGQSFTPALGTGGNEGRFEMSNNFMKQVIWLLLKNDSSITRQLLESSLFGTLSSGLTKSSIGQMFPGRAGGFNQGMGIEHKDFKINPWDYVLMMEGSTVLAGNVSRRYPTPDRLRFTTPFTVYFSPVGFSSNSIGEKGVYETWLPVWNNPASWAEVRHLFGEGRSVKGRRPTRTGLEFSRSVGVLGVDRGIVSFQRNIFLKRRGKSFIALPAGRIKVRYQPSLEILNELDPIIFQIETFIRGKNVPATFSNAYRVIQEYLFNCCENATTENFMKLMRATGKFERIIALRDRSLEVNLPRPLFGLTPRWLSACDDGSVEIRIAASIASIRQTGNVGTISAAIAGTKFNDPRSWSDEGKRHWYGRDLSEKLGNVLLRRIMEAEQKLAPEFPLEAELPINPYDVMPFLHGETDDEKTEELLWAFLLIDWTKIGLRKIRSEWALPVTKEPLSRTWCLLKLLHKPGRIQEKAIRREPRISKLLVSGRTSEACDVASKRLYVSGLKVFLVKYSNNDLNSTRLLASLLTPVMKIEDIESLVIAKTELEK